jgi:hypothetical protein
VGVTPVETRQNVNSLTLPMSNHPLIIAIPTSGKQK